MIKIEMIYKIIIPIKQLTYQISRKTTNKIGIQIPIGLGLI